MSIRPPLAALTTLFVFSGAAIQSSAAAAAAASACAADAPNPYHVDPSWPALPSGRRLGAVSAVTVDSRGHVWIADRCGANSCATSDLAPILEFDPGGKLLASFGAGLFVQPHGITIDRHGNIWVADAQSDQGKGQQVLKLSPKGKVLLRLGNAGVAAADTSGFNQPTSIAVAPNGAVFVAEGHAPTNGNSRIMKFTKDGKFLKSWGTKGTGAGQFLGPHALAFDSKGRLFVADRGNNRVLIFDQEGTQVGQLGQFGSPGGLYIDRHDVLYVADSSATEEATPGCQRGIWVADLASGKVVAFIPDPSPPPGPPGGTSAAEGVAVDRNGNVYGAEVFSKDVKKYVRNQ